ncbi:hypothetical protein Hanom_Chr10g00936341 [Helianthus anomalus]
MIVSSTCMNYVSRNVKFIQLSIIHSRFPLDQVFDFDLRNIWFMSLLKSIYLSNNLSG